MGRTTFQTIGKPLVGRRTIVMSRSEKIDVEGVECTDETPEELFAGNRQMMTVDTLQYKIDEFKKRYDVEKDMFKNQLETSYRYGILSDSLTPVSEKLRYDKYDTLRVLKRAMGRAKNISYQAEKKKEHLESIKFNETTFEVEKLHKYVQAVACIIMFLIGAPIGSVLKKGGLGFPGIITILFFIIYYVIYITFEKYARAMVLDVYVGSWGAIMVLLPFGLFFVYQASIDSSLFEIDLVSKVEKMFKKKR